MAITRQQAITITKEIETATNEILTKHNLVPSPPKTTYGDNYQIKITASELVTTGTGINMGSPEAQAFILNASMYGITNPEECFNETIHINGKEYALVGYKSRAPKRPFIMTDCSDGKTYVFPENIVREFPNYNKDNDMMNNALTPQNYNSVVHAITDPFAN